MGKDEGHAVGAVTLPQLHLTRAGRRPSLIAFVVWVILTAGLLFSPGCYHGGKRANAFEGNPPDIPVGGAPRSRWSIQETLKATPEADRVRVAPSMGVTVQEGPI